MPSIFYYWDSKKKKMVKGAPQPDFPRYGDAPMYISDDMKPTRHPATGQTITSRKAWAETDKVTGCVTLGKRENIAKPGRTKAEVDKDWDNAMDKAIADIDNDRVPFTEEQKAKHKAMNEQISKDHGIDAFNALGRKRRVKRKG